MAQSHQMVPATRVSWYLWPTCTTHSPGAPQDAPTEAPVELKLFWVLLSVPPTLPEGAAGSVLPQDTKERIYG